MACPYSDRRRSFRTFGVPTNMSDLDRNDCAEGALECGGLTPPSSCRLPDSFPPSSRGCPPEHLLSTAFMVFMLSAVPRRQLRCRTPRRFAQHDNAG
jgi:hypothetical protein